MVPSSNDMLAFVAELNRRRIALVLGRRQRRLGGLLLLNEKQTKWLLVARKLHHRYLANDYRHESQEVGYINDLANWLLEEHAKNERLSDTGKFIPLSEGKARRQQLLPAGTYDDYLRKVHCPGN